MQITFHWSCSSVWWRSIGTASELCPAPDLVRKCRRRSDLRRWPHRSSFHRSKRLKGFRQQWIGVKSYTLSAALWTLVKFVLVSPRTSLERLASNRRQGFNSEWALSAFDMWALAERQIVEEKHNSQIVPRQSKKRFKFRADSLKCQKSNFNHNKSNKWSKHSAVPQVSTKQAWIQSFFFVQIE